MSTQPAELPFLIEHGGWFWIVALLAISLSSFGLFSAIRVYALRRATRQRRATEHAHADALQLHTIEGRLRGSARTVAQLDRFNSERSPSLAIEMADGAIVDLCGPIEIRVGSKESIQFLGLPELPAHLLTNLYRTADTATRDICDGDYVIASGTLGGGTTAAAGYRDSGGRMGLVAEKAPVRIASLPPRVARRSPRRLGVLMAMHLIFWLTSMAILGDSLERDIDELSNRELRVDSFQMQLASLIPTSRARALKLLENASAAPIYSAQATLPTALALAELRGTCPHELYAKAFRYEEAVNAARRCGSRAFVVEHLLILGRYAEADAATDATLSWNLRITAAIGAGNWTKGASLLEAFAAKLPEPTNTRCLAALFRTYAGEVKPFESIVERAESPRCRALEALAFDPAQWFDTLDDLSIPAKTEDFRIANEIWQVVGGTPDRADPYRLTDEAGIWLAPLSSLHADKKSDVQKSMSRALLAQRAMWLGDVVAARAELDAARKLGLEGYDLRDLEFELGARTPGFSPPRPTRGESSYLSMSEASPYCEMAAHTALLAAQLGEGGVLADALVRCTPVVHMSVESLMYSISRIRAGRAEVATGLRLVRQAFDVRFDRLNQLVVRLGFYRDLARMLGDQAEADAMQTIVQRHAAMLSDPRRVVALRYWRAGD